jgi:DNA-binding transcriptional regulator LsrR (DeoR family)
MRHFKRPTKKSVSRRAEPRGQPSVGRREQLPEYVLVERLARVARQHFREGVDQAKIAEQEDVHPSTVNKWLATAMMTGVIAIDVDPSFGYRGRVDERASEQLRDAFELDDALVVTIDGHELKGLAADDYLHLVLGNQTGILLGGQIQRRDHLAVAGGRAVVQTVRAIKRRPPSRRDVRVSPLSGRIWAHFADFSGPNILRPLDPDDAAFALALAFEHQPGTQLSQVALPLYAVDSAQARDWMKAHCPFKPDGIWVPTTPRLAIVGAGAVSPASGHRHADVDRSEMKLEEIEPYIEGAATEVKQIGELAKKLGLPALGDVANRLFPAIPTSPDELKNLEKQFDALISRVDQLNKRTVVAEWSHLRAISRVRAVAGGVEKEAQIWTLLIVGLLSPDNRVITELTTDTSTAARLLSSLEVLRRRSSTERKAYQAITRQLFVS